MKMAIFGASGATGMHVLHQALNNGHCVTAFVRDPGKLNFEHPRLTSVVGDVRHFDSVIGAVTGQDAVISALGASSMFRLDHAVNEGISNIITAMTTARVDRLIYLSTLGVSATRRKAGFMIATLAPTLLRTEIKGHELRESMIRNCPLKWTIVRAPVLTHGALTEKYRSGEHLNSSAWVTKLSRADVAHCLISQLQNQAGIRKCLSVMPQEN